MKNVFCELEDATLIETFKSGERRAFDEIDRRYREKLTFFLLRKTSSREVAEELTQETLTRAYSALGSLDNGAFLSGWLYRIAYRIFIDWLRKTSRANCSTPYEESVFADDAPWRSSGAGALESREFRRPTGGTFGMSEPQESAMKSETMSLSALSSLRAASNSRPAVATNTRACVIPSR